MKKLLTPLFPLLCSALFLAGCGHGGGDAIAVGLSAELTGIERASDGNVSVKWDMVNPNVSSYLLSRVTNKIFLNGTLVGTTVDAEAMALPAQRTVNKVSKLTLAGPDAARLIAEVAARGRAAYRVDSQLVILLYGDVTEKSALTHAGSVPVNGK
ncbi:MAG: hypothetical protein PSW75_09560 [bacterium]|nr:hypothetical protein [bacterium]MDI1337417.1 hypothetical protein [Lacunisphaera sp.]